MKRSEARRYLELRKLGSSVRRASDLNLGRIGEVEIKSENKKSENKDGEIKESEIKECEIKESKLKESETK